MDTIPEEFADLAQEKREESATTQPSNFSDDLMEAVLEEQDIPVDLLKAAIRKGVIANELNPVFVGSPTRQGHPGAPRRRRGLPAQPA